MCTKSRFYRSTTRSNVHKLSSFFAFEVILRDLLATCQTMCILHEQSAAEAPNDFEKTIRRINGHTKHRYSILMYLFNSGHISTRCRTILNRICLKLNHKVANYNIKLILMKLYQIHNTNDFSNQNALRDHGHYGWIIKWCWFCGLLGIDFRKKIRRINGHTKYRSFIQMYLPV